MLYAYVIPPFQTPDEYSHFFRILQIADGHFLPVKSGQRVGGEVDACMDEFTLPYKVISNNPSYRLRSGTIGRSFQIHCDGSQKTFKDFPNTANYSPVSYLPQVMIIWILKQVNASPAALYYGGKLAIILVWLISMFFVIKLIPLHKWLLTCILLLPVHVNIAGAYSADTVTNIVALFLVSTVFRLCLPQTRLTPRTMLLLLLLGCTLAVCKMIYGGLLLMLFLIPAEKFGTKKKKYAWVTGAILLVFVLATQWSAMFLKFYIFYGEYDPAYRDSVALLPGANYFLQKQHLLDHPGDALDLLYYCLITDPWKYLVSYVGEFGTYMGLALPDWSVAVPFAGLILVAAGEKNLLRLTIKGRVVLLLSAAVMFVLLVISMHLIWNPVGFKILTTIQGRYLFPILPLLFFALGNGLRLLKFEVILVAIPLVIFSNAHSALILHERYIATPYENYIEFHCGFENALNNGCPTSDKNIMLNDCRTYSSTIAHEGRHFLRLRADEKGARTTIHNLQARDLVEIEVWRHGDSGRIAVAGCGPAAPHFTYYNDLPQSTDRYGWQKLNMTYEVTQSCGDEEVYFYLENTGTQDVYFDGLYLNVKKLKR